MGTDKPLNSLPFGGNSAARTFRCQTAPHKAHLSTAIVSVSSTLHPKLRGSAYPYRLPNAPGSFDGPPLPGLHPTFPALRLLGHRSDWFAYYRALSPKSRAMAAFSKGNTWHHDRRMSFPGMRPAITYSRRYGKPHRRSWRRAELGARAPRNAERPAASHSGNL